MEVCPRQLISFWLRSHMKFCTWTHHSYAKSQLYQGRAVACQYNWNYRKTRWGIYMWNSTWIICCFLINFQRSLCCVITSGQSSQTPGAVSRNNRSQYEVNLILIGTVPKSFRILVSHWAQHSWDCNFCVQSVNWVLYGIVLPMTAKPVLLV